MSMTNYINRLRRLKGRRYVDEDAWVTSADLPLDRTLTFSPAKDEKWSFKDESRIMFNDVEVVPLINECRDQVGVLCGLLKGLYDYQQFVWKKGGKEFEKFNALVFSIQSKISGRLHTIYDGLTGGVKFECDGDDFWINNVNVRSVLNLYWLRPTEKARHYLAGLRNKLGLILASQSSSTRYDGVTNKAERLYAELGSALEYTPPDAPYRITHSSRSS